MMPVSFRALLRIVSFTAAKTSRIFDVSVACVKLCHLLAMHSPDASPGQLCKTLQLHIEVFCRGQLTEDTNLGARG